MSPEIRATLSNLRADLIERTAASTRKATAMVGALTLVEAAHELEEWADEHGKVDPAMARVVSTWLLEYARNRIMAAQNGDLGRIIPHG